MNLHAPKINHQLKRYHRVTDNLQAGLQGILDTHLTPAKVTWYQPLHHSLRELQDFAKQAQTNLAQVVQRDNLQLIEDTGIQFLEKQHMIEQCFENFLAGTSGAKQSLLHDFSTIQKLVQDIITQSQLSIKSMQGMQMKLKTAYSDLMRIIEPIQDGYGHIKQKIKTINLHLQQLSKNINQVIKTIDADIADEVQFIIGALFSNYIENSSLVLSSFGVTIPNQRIEIDKMLEIINHYQAEVQSTLSDAKSEEVPVLTLQALTAPVQLSLLNLQDALESATQLQTYWETVEQDIAGLIHTLQRTSSISELERLQQSYARACQAWQAVVGLAHQCLNKQTARQNVTCEGCFELS